MSTVRFHCRILSSTIACDAAVVIGWYLLFMEWYSLDEVSKKIVSVYIVGAKSNKLEAIGHNATCHIIPFYRHNQNDIMNEAQMKPQFFVVLLFFVGHRTYHTWASLLFRSTASKWKLRNKQNKKKRKCKNAIAFLWTRENTMLYSDWIMDDTILLHVFQHACTMFESSLASLSRALNRNHILLLNGRHRTDERHHHASILNKIERSCLCIYIYVFVNFLWCTLPWLLINTKLAQAHKKKKT